MRKDADMVLSDVRSKRNDARKYLGILQELQNLREIKANIARARGEKLSLAAEKAFNNTIGSVFYFATYYFNNKNNKLLKMRNKNRHQ